MSLADLQPVQQIQHFKASAEAVFDAWLKPAIIPLWMFKNSKNEIIDADIDPQPGGRFSILERNEKKEYIDHFGKYQIISRPNRLIFSLKVPKHFDGETRVVVQIEEETGGCKLTLTQSGVEREKTESYWRDMLLLLKQVLKA
jgi:uncharacterized protein YndB with AHSA1/START domain